MGLSFLELRHRTRAAGAADWYIFETPFIFQIMKLPAKRRWRTKQVPADSVMMIWLLDCEWC